MNLSDTFYIALCMTVLILGVVYWFWTQNQYMQRKLNLLENIVYEMKTAFQSSGYPSSERGSAAEASEEGDEVPEGVSSREGSATGSPLVPVEYPPAPSSVLGEEDEDLLHEELHAESAFTPSSASESLGDRIQLLPPDREGSIDAEVVADDLQPGGVGSGLPVSAQTEAKGTVLDGMTLKELKRLAEQRGISGTSALRKQQLIDALRVLPATPSLASITPLEGVVDLS